MQGVTISSNKIAVHWLIRVIPLGEETCDPKGPASALIRSRTELQMMVPGEPG
jgi:hypothetical protein